MITLSKSIDHVLATQRTSGKPLAVVLAGHNGSGKSTMWYKSGLADKLQIPLINADRMMLSILPEEEPRPDWVRSIRDDEPSWAVFCRQSDDERY